MYKIGIIGTGKIGSHLADRLIEEDSISEIHLFNRNKSVLEGRLVSLEIKANILGSRTKITELDLTKADEIDLLIICIKDSYDPRELIDSDIEASWLKRNLRYVGLINDYYEIKRFCSQIHEYSGKVAVITNPVEITTSLVSELLPRADVFGLGLSLDIARLKYVLSKHSVLLSNGADLYLYGEHGAKLELYEPSEIKTTYKSQLSELIEESINLGFLIVNDLGFTLHDCIPVFKDDILWILSDDISDIRCLIYPKSGFLYGLALRKSREGIIMPCIPPDSGMMESVNSEIEDQLFHLKKL